MSGANGPAKPHLGRAGESVGCWLLALFGPAAVRVQAAFPVVPGVVACGAGAMMRRRSSSSNSSVDTCDKVLGGLVGRSAYPWRAVLGSLRRSVGASSLGSPPARMVSMLPGAQASLFSSIA